MMLLKSYSGGVSRGVNGVAHSSVFPSGASLSGEDSYSEASNFGISNPHGLDGGIVHDASVYSCIPGSTEVGAALGSVVPEAGTLVGAALRFITGVIVYELFKAP